MGWQTPGAGLLPGLACNAEPRQASTRIQGPGVMRSDWKHQSPIPFLKHMAQEEGVCELCQSIQAILYPVGYMVFPRSSVVHQLQG